MDNNPTAGDPCPDVEIAVEKNHAETCEQDPPPLDEQHARLAALRTLNSSGVRCILWAEDALTYGRFVDNGLTEGQSILIAGHQPDHGAALLKGHRYERVSFDRTTFRTASGDPEYLKAVYLQHIDIPEDEPWKLDPIPRLIRLLPQSHFGLDNNDADLWSALRCNVTFSASLGVPCCQISAPPFAAPHQSGYSQVFFDATEKSK